MYLDGRILNKNHKKRWINAKKVIRYGWLTKPITRIFFGNNNWCKSNEQLAFHVSCSLNMEASFVPSLGIAFQSWTKFFYVLHFFQRCGWLKFSGCKELLLKFFKRFGDYIYYKLIFLSITRFSMKFLVNISPGSWSFLFFLLIAKYEISPKLTKNPLSVEYVVWTFVVKIANFL